MLKLRRATVIQADPVSGPEQRMLTNLHDPSPQPAGEAGEAQPVGGTPSHEGTLAHEGDLAHGGTPSHGGDLAHEGTPAHEALAPAGGPAPDGAPRPAIADVGLTGPCEVGDEVVVNVEALDLGLGSGGFDIVHVNLTRGLAAAASRRDPLEGAADRRAAQPRGAAMKLNYTSLQHLVYPVEDDGGGQLPLPFERVVAVLALHGQLPAVAWSLAQASSGVRLGYVQTEGGALPGGHSRVVRELRERGLLAGHLTAGAAFGGEDEALTIAGALHHGLRVLGWDAAVCAPGPGVVGGGAPLGHGGLAALDSAHTALALGATTLLVPRMSSGDTRTRHRGISHHTLTVLDLLLQPVTVALPAGLRSPVGADLHAGLGAVFGAPRRARPQLELEVERPARIARHDWRRAPVDLPAFATSGLPTDTMGRGLMEDPLFFGAALAGGAVLAELAGQCLPEGRSERGDASEDASEEAIA
jgi:Protein of unknown function (DUF3866)